MGDRKIFGKSPRQTGSEEVIQASLPPSSGVHRALGDAEEAIERAEEIVRARLSPLEDLERDFQNKDVLPDSALTLPELFAWRAVQAPHETALNVVDFVDGAPQAAPLSCLELAQKVQRAASLLSTYGVRAKDRIILAIARPEAFLSFLLGAQCLGAVCVPVAPPAELDAELFAERVRAVLRDTRPKIIVIDDNNAHLDENVRSVLRVVHVGELARSLSRTPVGFSWSRRQDEIAFLASTSGSSGHPKTVVVLHRNLVANCRTIVEATGLSSEDRIYSWLPLFQPMGLVAGLLLGMYLGIPTYVAVPKSFARHPESWLLAIARFRATFSPGPSSAYELLLEQKAARTGINLRSWRIACVGLEAIDQSLARAFANKLGVCGASETCFRPVYGLTESTLAASFHEPSAHARVDSINRKVLAERGVATPVTEDSPFSATYVSVGRALPGHEIRIFEPGSERELPERHVGEIVVSGPSITPYYFHELLLGELPREVLRTGDLGYLADGELFVIDRMKDVLIVGGRRYAPSDVERVVSLAPGVQKGSVVAFTSRIDGGKDELVVAATLDARTRLERTSVIATIRDTVTRHFGLTPGDVLLVRPSDIARAPSGKIQRNACRALYEVGAFGHSPS